jgi:hypothetical protein
MREQQLAGAARASYVTIHVTKFSRSTAPHRTEKITHRLGEILAFRCWDIRGLLGGWRGGLRGGHQLLVHNFKCCWADAVLPAIGLVQTDHQLNH